jgi:hypothetical protein
MCVCLRVYIYIYLFIYLWFIFLPITLPISQLQGPSNPSQARQMWVLHPAVSFGATPDTQTESPLNYKEFVVLMWNCWSGVHGRGMLCHCWCFLHVVSVSWCLWVWAWNNYTYNYYYASPSSFQMLTQLPGAMLIQNVLLGSIPPLGHTFGTKGRAAIFVGTLQTSSAVTTCSWGIPGETLDWFNAKMYERGEWLSESHHLTTCGTHTTCCTAHPSPRPGGAFTVLAVGVAIQSLGTMGTACLQYLSDSQARFVWWSNGRIQILDCVSFGIFSEIQEKSRLDQNLFGHSLVQSVRLTISVFTCQIRGGQHHVDRAWKDVNVRMVRIQKIAIDMPGSDVLPHLLCTIKEWNHMAHLTRDWSILGHPT